MRNKFFPITALSMPENIPDLEYKVLKYRRILVNQLL